MYVYVYTPVFKNVVTLKIVIKHIYIYIYISLFFLSKCVPFRWENKRYMYLTYIFKLATFLKTGDIYIYIYIYIKCKILTFVKQCSIHWSRAIYILWEEKDKKTTLPPTI